MTERNHEGNSNWRTDEWKNCNEGKERRHITELETDSNTLMKNRNREENSKKRTVKRKNRDERKERKI